MIHKAGRPHPAWNKRPRARAWDRCEDEVLIQMIRDGCDTDFMPAVLDRPAYEVLERRKELVDEGKVELREPL